MYRNELYAIAKNLANELGKNIQQLKALWRTSTSIFWINQNKQYKKEIRLRGRKYNMALKLSRELKEPLSIPNVLTGTDRNTWIREVRRLKNIVKKNPLRVLNIQKERQRLRNIQMPDILRRQRQQRRARKIGDELKERVNILRYETITKNLKNGARIISYIHILNDDLRNLLSEDNIPDIRRKINLIVNNHRRFLAGKRSQIMVKDIRNGNTISSSYQANINDAVNYLIQEQLTPKAREYEEDNSFEVSQIILNVFIPPENIMGSSNSRSIEQANNKWHIVNPKSNFNCVFQSVAVCRNFWTNRKLLEKTEEASKKRIISGKNLKLLVKPSNDNFADNKTIQEICDFTRYPIKLYNNIFELIKEFKPKNPLARYRHKVKYYEIQKVGDHCLALVDKKLIKDKYPDFEFNVIEKMEEVKDNEDTLIKKRKFFDEYNYKFCAWDIETSKNKAGEHIPYACSIAWFDYEFGEDKITIINKKCSKNKKTYWVKVEKRTKNIIKSTPKEQQFWGLDCLQKMTKYIHDNKERFNGYTLYAHNGGKYDLPLAIKKAFIDSPEFLIEGKGCVELNNAWIGFSLRSRKDRKFKIYFRDSYRLLPMSLKALANELNVKHKKLDETISHEDITLINYNTYPQLKKYLTHDVFGLLEVIQEFGTKVFNDLGIDITKCFTGASLSKKNFFKNYYDTSKPIYKLSSDNDKLIRDSYFGGRVECFKMGIINKAYYYDFTSLYPDVGRKNLPYGKPTVVKLKRCKKLDNSFFGFVECLVRTKNKKCIPKHALIKDDRLIFPIFDNWTKISVFSEELDYEQYEYEFITGVQFKKGRIKQRFFNEGFRNKALSKKNGNPAMAQAYKIIINSGYGFWGLRTKDRDGIIICEPNSHNYMGYLNSDKLISIREHNDYVFCRIKKDLDVSDFNVGIAAAISSYARSKLHSLLTAVRKAGGKIYYCDTDSIICNINLNDYPDIKKKFQWDGNGEELGSLKNECDEYIEKIIKKEYPDKLGFSKEFRKKELQRIKDIEGGNNYFDKGIITGCKQYALQKYIMVNNKLHIIEIVKCKGYSQKNDKLKFENMVSLNRGNKMSQQQTQFRCPKSNYVSETKAFVIKSQKVIKSFRKTYSKGQILQNHVLPFRI